MDSICIVPNEQEGQLEQPLRQVCLPLMISPMSFKVSAEYDEDSDCDSDSDESVDMDDDAMTFEIGGSIS